MVVNSVGQIGMVVSAARYKRDIHDMDTASSKLLKLRPVTFVYKQDPKGERQYGLIAEEVARVYPELASYDTDGKVVTVHYHELVPMLLNELQRQARKLQKQHAELQEQTDVNERQTAQVSNLSAQLVAMRLYNRRQVAGLNADYERRIQSIQERLAAMERAMGKTHSGKLAAAFDR